MYILNYEESKLLETMIQKQLPPPKYMPEAFCYVVILVDIDLFIISYSSLQYNVVIDKIVTTSIRCFYLEFVS